MRIRYEPKTEEFKQAFAKVVPTINRAAKEAVKKTATLARDNSRKNIASAGFSGRWQKAMQFKMEQSPPDTFAAANVFHRIPFAVLFEEGGTIRGKPKLWIPIKENLPFGIKSARDYVKRVGPLVSVNHPGKPPLLFAKRQAKKVSPLSAERRARLAQVKGQRRALLGKSPSAPAQESKPLFVGVDSVTLRKRFRIYDQIRAATDQTGNFYFEAIRVENP